ncbi:4Fe-4S binding protein [Methylocaldum sp.]|uniref:4Fe-4S binding protein n=1 Tax=Methylocaldum sp. TaxID=1969727 RepID=UPI002D64B085|nr:4Fe-4S binding protein [Methylocaldum sp.]HYE36002.1 4Fe-4S binding protein [Methylocaldum sp.]
MFEAPDSYRPSPRQATKQVASAYEVEPTGLVSYRSNGCLLIIGDADAVVSVTECLPATLRGFVLFTDSPPDTLAELLKSREIAYLELCSDTNVEGHLGAFRVEARCGGIRINVGAVLLPPNTAFDLILDLQDSPSIGLPVPPIGYFAPGGDSIKRKQALDALAELLGEFDKPKFFEYRPELCAHGASRIEGCRACLDACGTGAIESRGDRVAVDPYRCQGCGECATVCPSGAMNYAYPRRKDSLKRLRLMLEAFFGAGGSQPELLLHDSNEGAAWINEHETELPKHILPYELEALGSCGMDFWLAALAYGVGRVTLLTAGKLTEPTRQVLVAQVGYAGEILSGMGYPRGLIRLVRAGNSLTAPELPSAALRRAHARFAADDDKRTVIRLAVEHLYRQTPWQPESVVLSAGAPFGEVRVDKEKCTLCLACVSVCPERALADGRDQPQLKFIEANCVQCRLCEKACPEDAMALAPRYLFDAQQSRQIRLLKEEAVFRCVECDKPFATAAMIKTITERLQNHPMFQGDNLRRLLMCEECRVKAHLGQPLQKP